MAKRGGGRGGGGGKQGSGKGAGGKQGAGWPSKKPGKLSGGGRDNNPPKSGKK